MQKFLLAIVMTIHFLSCHAEIQVNTMQELFSYFRDSDSKTLAIFDVDMVLVQPDHPAFQMANMKRYSAITKEIMREIPADRQMIFLSLMTIRTKPVLIDANTPQLLQEIIQRGIPTMAMTANLTGEFMQIKSMERWRIGNLRQLGIDFSNSTPWSSELVFDHLPPYRGNYSTYLEGIFFVNGTVISKGEALTAFLSKTGFCPDRIIFADDRIENLKSMETAAGKLGIAFQGLHYVGAQHYPSQIISEEEFEACWLELAKEAKSL